MRAESYVVNTWYVAGFSTEFPESKLQGQTIAEKPIVMWRTASGEVVAFDGRCAHKRMPLKDGRLLANGSIECPYHGFCYDASGTKSSRIRRSFTARWWSTSIIRGLGRSSRSDVRSSCRIHRPGYNGIHRISASIRRR